MNPTTANLSKIDGWLDRLAAETDEARYSAVFTSYLSAMTKFWRYSHQNTLLIALQCPQATRINSRKRWEALGYTLKDGEWKQAIQILCPHFKKGRDAQTGDEIDILTHFSTGYVYDVAQVQPSPQAQPLTLPWATLTGDYAALYALLHAVCTNLHITVRYADLEPGIEGQSTGKGEIILARRLSPGNAVQTLIHELAHELVHPSPVRPYFSKQEVECQAESIAYCVSTALEMPTPNMALYLALYRVTPDVLRANTQAIRVGVHKIMSEIERISTMPEQGEAAEAA